MYDPGFSNVVLWEMYFRTDEKGRTFAERFETGGLSTFKNDHRCLFRAKSGMYLALLEVQRVIDAQSFECRDLFNPLRPAFVVFDRTGASRVCRFDAMLCQCYDLPHFTRLFGTAVPIPYLGTMEQAEVVREIVAHLGGPGEGEPMRRWLLEHLNRFTEALGEVGTARGNASLAGANFKISKALYELAAPYSECRSTLDTILEVLPDKLTAEQKDEGFSDARVWLARDEESTGYHDLGREVLGTVALGQSYWRLEALTEEQMQKLRENFEAALGARVKLHAMRMDDPPSFAEARAATPSSLVPPSLLKDLPQLSVSTSRLSPVSERRTDESLEEQVMRSADRVFIDDSVPALDGATPRAAAKHAKLAGKLRQLLKQRINGADRKNLENGGRYDAAWVAAELGMGDLCIPAPPPRALPQTDDHEATPGVIRSSARKAAPPLPLHLPPEEVTRRMETAMNALHDAAALHEEAFASGCTWLEDVDELIGEQLSDSEYTAISSALLQAWFAMVPLGYCGPEIPLHHVTETLSRFSGELDKRAAKVDLGALKSRYQEHIGALATVTFIELSKKKKVLRGKKPEKTIFLVVVLNAFIDEMHVSLGGPTTQ